MPFFQGQRFSAIAVVAVLVTSAVGCASARMSDRESDNLFRERRYDEAAEHLKKGLAEQGETSRDSLLYFLDIGLALHTAGHYEESNKVFLRADKIAEIKDYTSLTTEGATFVTSDNLKDYKGEDFEKVLINTYLAMNYALMGNNEDALVEARRVNRKLYMMVTEGERNYKQNAFARYLSAILYENDKDWNDAYVDYKNTYKLTPSFPGLGRDLWRLAILTHANDETEKWDKEFNLTDEDHQEAMKAGPKSGMGEIVVLYENGISPVKRPNPSWHVLPKFYPRPNPVREAKVWIRSVGSGPARSSSSTTESPVVPLDSKTPPPPSSTEFREAGTTAVLHDIEETAIQNLDDNYSGLIAKKVAGVVVKEAVGAGVEKATKSPLLGMVAKIAMYAADQPDLRSWNLLPRDLQLLRIPVQPGTYEVRVDPLGASSLPTKVIQVTAGKKVFIDYRYMP